MNKKKGNYTTISTMFFSLNQEEFQFGWNL